MGCVRLASDERPGVVYELRVLASWWGRLRGLLATTPDASPVLLARCASVHTVGMGYNLDVALVGEDGEGPARDGPWPAVGERLWIVSASPSAAGRR